ncbi:MAG: hypothetical protein FGF52_03855 [Candidatus Brockarchaeota archaeon]|nr:hypothetical protein [Candidatus Brockarchaeota archaeon]
MVLKVGFIGCGGIAETHMQVLSRIKEIQLVSFCDVVEEKARLFNSRYAGEGVRFIVTLKKCLKKKSLTSSIFAYLPLRTVMK